MDGNTEPLIAVIGYPIADNPAEFALERALAAMGLDWRVLSFEIPPDQLGAALDAIEVLRFHGAVVDHATANLTGQWYAQRHGTASAPLQPVDCLFRPRTADEPAAPAPLQVADAHGDWLREAVRRHFENRGRTPEQGLCVGPQRNANASGKVSWSDFGIERAEPLRYEIDPDSDQIEAADVIVLTAESDRTVTFDRRDWPADDTSTLVIDLTDLGHPDAEMIEAKGYRLVTSDERRVGTLVNCLWHWTGQEAEADIIQDAIDEYMAV